MAAPVFTGTRRRPPARSASRPLPETRLPRHLLGRTTLQRGRSRNRPSTPGTQVTPQGTIQTDTPGGTVAIVNAATASTGLTAITLKPGSSLALVGDGTSA